MIDIIAGPLVIIGLLLFYGVRFGWLDKIMNSNWKKQAKRDERKDTLSAISGIAERELKKRSLK